jgi:Kef-type K+ transport system membrane component KefB
VIRAAVLLALVAGLAFSARSFLPPGVEGNGAATLAFGFLLLAALMAGRIFHRLRLPHLTGFLLTGLVFGPEVLGLLTKSSVAHLALVKRVAFGLIALYAGCEINLAKLKPKLRAVGLILVIALTLAGVLLWCAVFLALHYLPFAAQMSEGQRAIVALIGANVLMALSPAVAIGIVQETRAAGPLTEMVLSVVVVADLFVVITFTMSESVAGLAFPHLHASGGAASLASHILGSLAIGAGAGAVMAVFVRRVGQKIGLFVFGVLFVIAEAGGVLHLDPLLAGLAAGLFLENVSAVSGAEVVHETEIASLPTLAVFFGVVGAELHMHEFFQVVGWAALCAVVRAIGLTTGSQIAARTAGLDDALRRRLPFGLLPQAGVALALALLVRQKFDPFGAPLSTLLLGTIVVNEMIGPVLWRNALVRAGEVGARSPAHAPHARRASTIVPEPPAEPAEPLA